MNDNSLTKLGGTCSILLGISYILVGVTSLALPVRPGFRNFDRVLEATYQNPTLYVIYFAEFGLGAILALAVLPAIAQLVRPAHQAWLRWTTNIAYLGFGVVAISAVRQLALLPPTSASYAAGDASTQAAIIAPGTLSLDPLGWLGFGGVGLWVLVVSLLLQRDGTSPKPLAYVGIAVALAYWAVVLSLILQVQALQSIAALLGGVILAPIWYVWLGLRLRKAGP